MPKIKKDNEWPGNRYDRIISHIFFSHYQKPPSGFAFSREEFIEAATALGISVPKNIGDVLYSFRFRAALPEKVASTAPSGKAWIIKLAGRGQYRFELVGMGAIIPNELLAETRIPDATPGMIDMYALNDEQALLGKLHYNRLIDVFLGLASYRLQSHLRTTVPKIGQVETDELYVGIDSKGIHYVIPIQAKGGNDRLSIVQVEQDLALCSNKFPSLRCIPIAAQFMKQNLIALFSFADTGEGVAVQQERHYRLVPPESMTPEEWESYRQKLMDAPEEN